MDPKRILHAAQREFQRELFNRRVQEEVERLRTRHDRSLWQRLLDKLPFTITWKKNR